MAAANSTAPGGRAPAIAPRRGRSGSGAARAGCGSIGLAAGDGAGAGRWRFGARGARRGGATAGGGAGAFGATTGAGGGAFGAAAGAGAAGAAAGAATFAGGASATTGAAASGVSVRRAGRARRKQRRGLVVLSRRRERAIDLQFDQNVVRAADHDQMLDIVAPDEDQLPLAVEAERVDEAKPRLAGPSARNAQPMGERQSINDRQDDERGDAARRQESYLDDPIIGERKLIQPLHAKSKTPAERATTCSSASAFERRLRRAAEKRDRRRPKDWAGAPPALAPPARAESVSALL